MFDSQDFQPLADTSEATQAATQLKNDTDVSSVTVSEFRDRYSMTTDEFTNLKRRAKRSNPELNFEPKREGSKTYWVRNLEILEDLATEQTALATVEQTQEVKPFDFSGKTRKFNHVKPFEVTEIGFSEIADLQSYSNSAKDQTDETLSNVQSMLEQFATFRIAQGFAEIDAAVSGMVNTAVNNGATKATKSAKKR